MDDRQFGYKQKFLLKKYCFTSVIMQGSKAKVEVGARESVHMHRKMSAQPQKLSDSWASTPLIGRSASQFAYPLRSPSPLSSIKNYRLEGQ